MIRILHVSRVRRDPAGSHWIYLGKSMEPYRRVRQQLGAENEWLYDSKLREASEELRQPFLDFVARVGERQADPLAWWSTRFSWKRWTASDLFLLTCYLAVAQSCVEQARRARFDLWIVVEDRWLLRQIRDNLRAGTADLRVDVVSIFAEPLKQILLGVARRAKWLATTAVNYARQRRAWPRPGLPAPSAPAAGIASYPSESAFGSPGKWRDVYLPELDRFLEGQGLQVVRFTAPEYGGWHRQIAERSSFVYPLILWATPSRIFRSLRSFWWPRWPDALSVRGHSVRWLCLREWWLEVGRASLCAYRLYYECVRGMLSKGSWRTLISFYENQPWEKLQVLAARASGVRTVGIQVSLFSRFYLPHALGRGEQERLPLPDLLGSSGEAARRLWEESGFPASSLRLCGALRYPDLAERTRSRNPAPPKAEERSRVLVVLPIDPELTRHLLDALARAFPDGGAADGLRLRIRAHPVEPMPRDWVQFPATIAETTSTNLQEDLSACGVVLFAGSTVGLEALAEGKVVLRYRSPRLFDLDDSYGVLLPVVSDRDLRTQLLAHVRGEARGCAPEDAMRLIRDYFQPVDSGELLALFHDKI